MSNLVINNHIIDTPMLEIVQKIKSELVNGKLKDYQLKGDTVRVTCPIHKDGMEQHPSCGVYCGDSPDIEYGAYHCFTCGASGSLIKFVSECFNKSESFGRSWLLENFGNTFYERQIELIPIDLKAQKNSGDFLDEAILDTYQSYHPYLLSRKIPRNVCEKFKVKYDQGTNSIVFPVWDETGNLYMLTRRSVSDKVFIIDADKEKPIYLLNHVKEIGATTVIVTESQINCLTCYAYNIPSIALFGTGTKEQYNILKKSGIRHYILCFDGDDAGRKGAERFIKNMNNNVFITDVVMPNTKDVNDLSKEEFLTILAKNGVEYEDLLVGEKNEDSLK